MLVIMNHEPRIKQLMLGPATAHKRTHQPIQPPMITLYSGRNVITDPKICELIKACPSFKRAVDAAAKQRQDNKKLRGFDFEEFKDNIVEEPNTKPAPKAKGKAANTDDDEIDGAPTVNPYKYVPSEKMKAIIEGTTTIQALQEMQAVEDRAPLSAAITRRIKALRKDLEDHTTAGEDDE